MQKDSEMTRRAEEGVERIREDSKGGEGYRKIQRRCKQTKTSCLYYNFYWNEFYSLITEKRQLFDYSMIDDVAFCNFCFKASS